MRRTSVLYETTSIFFMLTGLPLGVFVCRLNAAFEYYQYRQFVGVRANVKTNC